MSYWIYRPEITQEEKGVVERTGRNGGLD